MRAAPKVNCVQVESGNKQRLQRFHPGSGILNSFFSEIGYGL